MVLAIRCYIQFTPSGQRLLFRAIRRRLRRIADPQRFGDAEGPVVRVTGHPPPANTT